MDINVITEQRWQEIWDRAAAATDGPWVVGDNGTIQNTTLQKLITPSLSWMGHKLPLAQDADFIAKARQDVVDLLAYCAALKDQLEKARRERDAAESWLKENGS